MYSVWNRAVSFKRILEPSSRPQMHQNPFNKIFFYKNHVLLHMGICEYCGKITSIRYTCSYCGEQVCGHHKIPENHKCIYLDIVRAREDTRLPKSKNKIFSTALLEHPFPRVYQPRLITNRRNRQPPAN